MRNGFANLADFSDSKEVGAMLRGDCAQYLQSFDSMIREAASTEGWYKSLVRQIFSRPMKISNEINKEVKYSNFKTLSSFYHLQVQWLEIEEDLNRQFAL